MARRGSGLPRRGNRRILNMDVESDHFRYNTSRITSSAALLFDHYPGSRGRMSLRNVATQLRLARAGQQARCFSASSQQLQARLAVLGAGQMV